MPSARYLLDTNILSDLARNPGGRVTGRIREVGPGLIATTVVVACEVRFGAAKSDSRKLRQRLELLLNEIEVLPFEAPADRHYAEIRLHLERAGTPIGPNDLLIAAHARALDLVLVTDNEKEFARVKKLSVENWLRG
jgi:tRNA(fMet)-specific endonuclease VapC